ncbi:polysaccharide biosynthesis/export family protein [Altererythrobacter lauratis]|uniref:Polysaccharide biosynthesis/export family protein n=1 Tax=Alteraurantiacibacter lauratis TaxID=2054627 RepID=A0ABV7EBW2_9SPHN
MSGNSLWYEGRVSLSMFDRLMKAAMVCVLAGLAAACATGPKAMPGMAVTSADTAANQQITSNDRPAAYVLRANDVIRMSVFREEDLSLDNAVISAEGTVSFPLIGEVRAAGLTLSQLEQQIATELGARYLRNPSVTVNIVSYASHQVTVEGAVQRPGVYTFLPGTRLSGGIALGGGADRVAAREEIAVFRETPQGMEIAKFSYSAIQAGTMLDPVLMPGDRIVVGTDGLSQFWQDLLRTLPLFALFTRL